MTIQERVAQLVEVWPQVYPGARCELDFRNPLELLVATILSAQCTDKRVNMVTPALFKKYRRAKDYANASQAELDSKVPETMEALHALPGVGRKTANVVLGNAFGKDEGIVVDTHVARLSQRLGLTKHKDADKIERDLMKLVPREHWTDWSHWLIWHGRRRCFARKPDCSQCEVFQLCPSGKPFLRTGVARRADD